MLHRINRLKWRGLMLMLALLLISVCNNDPVAGDAEATITALAAENARLATAVATLEAQPAAAAPALARTRELTATNSTTANLASSAGSAPALGPLPHVLAEIALAPEGATLLDFRRDAAANRLYVSDSAGHLYVLDATTQERLATLPVAGELTLDPTHQRLYVAPGDSYYLESPAISVVDTAALTVTASITNATHLALDPDQNRLFVGNRLSMANEENGPGVRILDADTLTVIAESSQTGIPVYNAVREELFIVAYTIYSADPATGAIRADLLPELADQSPRWCNGCIYVANAWVFAAEQLVAFDVQPMAVGKGAGDYLPPRLFDATSMQAVEQAAAIPEIQPSCGSQLTLQGPVADRLYRHQFYDRYIVYNNVLVNDLAGNLLIWRDGLGKLFVNANTGQAYTNGWALDLASLNPLGPLPRFCPFYHDQAAGILYGSRQGNLIILAETGGVAPTPAQTTVTVLPESAVDEILVSPAYATDATLFTVNGNGLYRSIDDGINWTQLRPGATQLDVAISPAYATDRTLFTGGHQGEGWGEGVMRSTDGGDTWQPLWNNLTYLRIEEIALSPAYATDQTLFAYSPYMRLATHEAGYALQRSTDAGLSWSTMMTATAASGLPTPAEVINTAAEPPLPLRIAEDGASLEGSSDGGQSWTPIDLDLPEDYRLDALLPSPDGSLYLLGDANLWRITNNGASIETWADPRLADRTATNRLTALAISPRLNDGGYRIFLATFAGEFWTLDPAQMTWQPLDGAAVTPAQATVAVVSPLATPSIRGLNTVTNTASLTATNAVTALTGVPAVTSTLGITTALLPLTGTFPISGGVGNTATTAPGETPTPPPPLAGEPPTGFYRPGGGFMTQWENDTALQTALGWAKDPLPKETPGAIQTFDNGVMIWRGDTQQIYVIYKDRTWQVFSDTFKEGQAESDPSINVPGGKLQPIRGFGKIWRESPSVRDKLGWATAKESGYSMPLQIFERGVMLRIGGLVYALAESAEGEKVWY